MKEKNISPSLYIGLSILFLLFLPTIGLCNVPSTDSLQIIQDQYISNAKTWETTLSNFAFRLFWALAFIDFVWMAINVALNPGEFSNLFSNLIRKILFLGFFLALLQNGPDWANSVISSFQQAGSSLPGGGVGSRPSDIFDLGFSLAVKIFDKISVFSPGDSIGYIIAGYIIMIVFSLIAAMALLITVQAAIVMFAGIILLGFGGSVFTKDISLAYFKAALSSGVKLFIMTLIVRIGVGIVENWALTFVNPTFKQMSLFIGAGVVLLALVKAIPDMVGDLINGFSWGSGDSLVTTGVRAGKMALGGAAGAVAGAAGGAMAVKEAAKMASTSGASGIMGKTASIVSNLGKASAQQVGQKLSGSGPSGGNALGRTAAILKENHLSTSSSKKQGSSGSIGKDNS